VKRLGFLALFLSSACSSSNNQWAVDHVQASNPEFASSKLTFQSKDRNTGVDLELLKIGTAQYLYLTVHSQTVPAYNHNAKAARVFIHTNNERIEVIAYRHEGGQRLLLPEAVYPLVLDSLKTGKDVTIALEGYTTTIDSANFQKQYKSWQSPPFMKNPFHLPF
jgi:hypothetical protein